MPNDEDTQAWETFQRGDRAPAWWREECEKTPSAIENDIGAEYQRSGGQTLSVDQRRLIALVNCLANVPMTKVLVALADALEGIGNVAGVPFPAVEAEVFRRARLFSDTSGEGAD